MQGAKFIRDIKEGLPIKSKIMIFLNFSGRGETIIL